MRAPIDLARATLLDSQRPPVVESYFSLTSCYVAVYRSNSVMKAIFAAQYGQLTPGRCLSARFKNIMSTPVAAAPQPIVLPKVQQQAPTSNDPMKIALKESGTTILEIRAKRLSGELKTYLASA